MKEEDRRQKTGDRSQEPEDRRQVMKNGPAKNFQELIVWQKAHEFVLQVYRFTEEFPAKENFCLSAQFRRSAISVPANIAEGFRKKGKQDKIRFLSIAQDSLEECKYYLLLSKDLKYGETNRLMTLAEEVSKLLDAYSKAISNSV
jgi:four helix bundle protein